MAAPIVPVCHLTVPKAYITEVESALAYIRKTPDISVEEVSPSLDPWLKYKSPFQKRRFYKSVNRNFGASALCLSGGASFGYYHIGLVKAFLDAGLLPRVIAGTSAGGLIAALVCTRTDEELKRLLVPQLAHKITACSEPFTTWFTRYAPINLLFLRS